MISSSGSIKSIAVDPQDWQRAWVLKGESVAYTDDAGITWQDVTHNLSEVTTEMRRLTVVDDTLLVGDATPVVGGLGGVFRLIGSNWAKFGQSLPNTLVHDLKYIDDDLDNDATNGTGILLAGSFGRGAWTIENVSESIHARSLLTLPGARSLQRLWVDSTGATRVVLVGGEGGVFRLVGTGDWTEYGGGLPNALVTSLDQELAPDDLLLAGTLGRGAWTVPAVSQTSNVRSRLLLNGSDSNDVFDLVRDSTEPWLLNIFIYLDGESRPDVPQASVPFSVVESIFMDGRGGNDRFVVDASHGAIVAPGGNQYRRWQ